MDFSSDDEWIVLDAKNPADSSDDDRGVLALGSPTCSDYELDLDLSSDDSDDDDSVTSRRAAVPDDDDYMSSDPYELECDDDADPYAAQPLTRPLSGMFHHTPWDSVAYAAFDPLRAANSAAKRLIPDPAFAVFPETVTVLASTRGLVCLRGNTSGLYYVANPATFRRVRLPPHTRDHRLDAEPAVVITFEQPPHASSAGFHHYSVVVAFQVHDGVWAVESFSSRTWDWTVGSDICAPETVIASSGVGALGRAFWRTTIGHILCVTPETGTVDLIPAPHEVDARPDWEIGEMEGNFAVACADNARKEVAALYLVAGEAGATQWQWAGQFDGEKAGCHPGMTLLRSQGAAEVVVWDSVADLVIALDFDGRQTRSIGPLNGGNYYTDFIPYIGTDTEIYSEEVGAMFITVDAVTYRIPQSSVKEEQF
ncbi:uncharacterized protein [Lolium perenne]|uniref:uncharacterized protein n=1 Tax=Lolium perenne TaxID=4522 RepID=UPI0021F5E084|nr:uncharacterized protein LOC127319749 [Lolium perenne]